MAQVSAGILLYRRSGRGLEVFLIHMGGPFWARKDAGAWSIPKGLIDEGRGPARRRAAGVPRGDRPGRWATSPAAPHALQPVRQAGGKVVHAWAVEG